MLPIWFEIHTYAGRPVKTPVPPRIWVVKLPFTSQLRPNRGDQRIFLSGRPPFVLDTRAGFVSERQRVGDGIGEAGIPELGKSMRSPPFNFRLLPIRQSSCA